MTIRASSVCSTGSSLTNRSYSWTGSSLCSVAVVGGGATISAEVFAADALLARRFFQQRYGNDVEVQVVGPSECRVEVVPWESWTTDAAGQLFVWAWVDEPAVRVEETAEIVRVELRERRFQGGRAGPLHTTKVPVPLRAPVGRRAVVDDAIGEARPEGRTT